MANLEKRRLQKQIHIFKAGNDVSHLPDIFAEFSWVGFSSCCDF